MEFRARRRALGQGGLDVHVNILEGWVPLKTSGVDFVTDLFEPVENLVELLLVENADFFQHPRMSH